MTNDECIMTNECRNLKLGRFDPESQRTIVWASTFGIRASFVIRPPSFVIHAPEGR